MTRWSSYHTPRTLEAAIQVLMAHPDSAIIAGGTDLLLDLDQRRHPPVAHLIDISKIDDLLQCQIIDDQIVIGAALPLSRILIEDLIRENAPGLIEACGLIGGPQVRNVATLGGNVAHALPAGDGTIALLSLGAEARLMSQDKHEWVGLSQLFAGPGKVAFDRQQTLLTALRFKLRERYEGSAFDRVMRPQGVAIAIMNMGIWLRCGSDGKISEARIAVGPGGPVPFLAKEASSMLAGLEPSDAVLSKVAQAIREEAQFRTSRHRSTKSYREHLVAPLLMRTLPRAYQRAMQSEVDCAHA